MKDNEDEQMEVEEFDYELDVDHLPKFVCKKRQRTMKICQKWAYGECTRKDECEFYHVQEVKKAKEAVDEYTQNG